MLLFFLARVSVFQSILVVGMPVKFSSALDLLVLLVVVNRDVDLGNKSPDVCHRSFPLVKLFVFEVAIEHFHRCKHCEWNEATH